MADKIPRYNIEYGIKELDRAIEKGNETYRKYSQGSDSIPVTEELFEMVVRADVITHSILGLSRDDLRRIKGLTGEYTDERASMNNYGMDIKVLCSSKEIRRDQIEIALKILKTGRTLKAWQEKLDTFRQLKSLDEAFEQ